MPEFWKNSIWLTARSGQFWPPFGAGNEIQRLLSGDWNPGFACSIIFGNILANEAFRVESVLECRMCSDVCVLWYVVTNLFYLRQLCWKKEIWAHHFSFLTLKIATLISKIYDNHVNRIWAYFVMFHSSRPGCWYYKGSHHRSYSRHSCSRHSTAADLSSCIIRVPSTAVFSTLDHLYTIEAGLKEIVVYSHQAKLVDSPSTDHLPQHVSVLGLYLWPPLVS